MGIEFLSGDCIIAAPMMTEIKRQEIVQEYHIGAWANKCIIEKEWRVRNPVFDKKGEKTTTMMRVRPAKTKDEIDFIVSQLEKELARLKSTKGGNC